MYFSLITSNDNVSGIYSIKPEELAVIKTSYGRRYILHPAYSNVNLILLINYIAMTSYLRSQFVLTITGISL
jgi:hypothetical protein